MNGQWIGNYTGSSPGLIIVNVDERPTYYEGVAYLQESQPVLPSTAAYFRTPNKEREFRLRTNAILPINPATGLVDLWDNVSARFPGACYTGYDVYDDFWEDA